MWRLIRWTLRLAPFILLGIVLWPCVSHGTPDDEMYDHELTVLTYNTHRMGEFRHAEQNGVIQYLLMQHADVLCLQEVEVYHDTQYLTLDELKKTFADYPYTYFDFSVYNSRRQFGNVVFSRYPLVNKQTVRYSSRANISSRCDVVVDGDTVRLITNHLESNRIEKTDMNIQEKYESAKTLRQEQARKVHAEVVQSPYPVIVVGDFNDMPLSSTYQMMSEGLTDCFLRCSWGKWGATYMWHDIGLRIDYILVSGSLHPMACEVDEVAHSDHYPVRAVVGW